MASVPQPAAGLHIASSLVIQHYEDNPFDFSLDDYAIIHPFDYAEENAVELAPFLKSLYPAAERPVQTFSLMDRMNRDIAVAVARHPEAVPPVAGSYLGPFGVHPLRSVEVRVSALAV